MIIIHTKVRNDLYFQALVTEFTYSLIDKIHSQLIVTNLFPVWKPKHNKIKKIGPKTISKGKIVYDICSTYIFIYFKQIFIYVICNLDRNYQQYFQKSRKLPLG